MPISRIAIGTREEVVHPGAFKAALAEFFATLIFVYAGQGSGIAFSKLTSGGAGTPAGLVAAALAHGFGLFAAVSVAANISGGHLLGSTVACLLLRFTTGLPTGTFGLTGIGAINGLVLEIVITFGLVYTVYATAVDPKRGNLGTIAPIAIGFIVGANILFAGAFTGASMNPAVAFGPALVSFVWTDHWIYWVGPLIGGGLAGVIYELLFISHSHEQLPTTDY
ncbi:hypothetical protein HPP92_025129 [Vanilla planifolia]|uniref:Tonoplast intrinsic protein n=1 Tax=Vanilla planifolia TaxID=51239 RepID=A0A835PK12_VANPL|nr:hypothetical protein HPP92_025129 [Vanilla planifolia]